MAEPNFSTMSDDDLLASLPKRAAPTTGASVAPPAAAPDYSKMSDDELLSGLQPHQAQPTAAPERGVGQQIGRQLGLTVRAGIKGLNEIPNMAADALGGMANLGLDAALGSGNGPRIPSFGKALDRGIDSSPLPQPETPVERVAGEAASAVAGTGGIAGLGKLLLKGASGVAQAVGKGLSAETGLQTASAATGAGAAGATREGGGGEGAQLAAGLAGALIPGVVSPSRVPTAGGAQVRAAAQKANEVGYVIPPADVSPGLMTEALGGIGGKIKLQQTAAARNQTLSDKLARRAVGLGEDAELSLDSLEAVRRSAAAAYEPVAASGIVTPGKRYEAALDRAMAPFRSQSKSFPGTREPQVVADLQALRSPQFDAGDAMTMIRSMRESADRAYRAGENMAGKAYRQGAAALEDALEGHLQSMGQPAADILQGFRDARQLIAKTYSVQSALGPNGSVNAVKLGANLAKGRPLSGELRTVAEFGQAFPKSAQMLKEPPGSTSVLDWATAMGSTAASGNPAFMLSLGARPLARRLMLSDRAQRNAVKNAGTEVQRIPDSTGAIAAGAAARSGNTEAQPEQVYANRVQAGYRARAQGGEVVPVQGGWVIR